MLSHHIFARYPSCIGTRRLVIKGRNFKGSFINMWQCVRLAYHVIAFHLGKCDRDADQFFLEQKDEIWNRRLL